LGGRLIFGDLRGQPLGPAQPSQGIPGECGILLLGDQANIEGGLGKNNRGL